MDWLASDLEPCGSSAERLANRLVAAWHEGSLHDDILRGIGEPQMTRLLTALEARAARGEAEFLELLRVLLTFERSRDPTVSHVLDLIQNERIPDKAVFMSAAELQLAIMHSARQCGRRSKTAAPTAASIVERILEPILGPRSTTAFEDDAPSLAPPERRTAHGALQLLTLVPTTLMAARAECDAPAELQEDVVDWVLARPWQSQAALPLCNMLADVELTHSQVLRVQSRLDLFVRDGSGHDAALLHAAKCALNMASRVRDEGWLGIVSRILARCGPAAQLDTMCVVEVALSNDAPLLPLVAAATPPTGSVCEDSQRTAHCCVLLMCAAVDPRKENQMFDAVIGQLGRSPTEQMPQRIHNLVRAPALQARPQLLVTLADTLCARIVQGRPRMSEAAASLSTSIAHQLYVQTFVVHTVLRSDVLGCLFSPLQPTSSRASTVHCNAVQTLMSDHLPLMAEHAPKVVQYLSFIHNYIGHNYVGHNYMAISIYAITMPRSSSTCRSSRPTTRATARSAAASSTRRSTSWAPARTSATRCSSCCGSSSAPPPPPTR